MKTHTNRILYLRKNITLIFMLVLLISSLWAKHVRAQSTLWAENTITGKQIFFALNKGISYRLLTSTTFHDGRLTAFTDSTLTVRITQMDGPKFVTIKFKDLVALKKGMKGRRALGAVISSFGLIAATVALTSAFSFTNTSSLSGPKPFALGLSAVPVGIILMSRKKIDLTDSWMLKTK